MYQSRVERDNPFPVYQTLHLSLITQERGKAKIKAKLTAWGVKRDGIEKDETSLSEAQGYLFSSCSYQFLFPHNMEMVKV